MDKTASFSEFLAATLAGQEVKVPVIHPLALKMQSLLLSGEFEAASIGRLINQDPALAAKILRTANSSFFSGLAKVSTVQNALVRLGAKQVANLIMIATQQDAYHCQNKLLAGFVPELWKHSYACAMGARWLAGKLGFEHLAQEALMAALLHDIGKIFLIKVIDDLERGGACTVEISESVVTEILRGMHNEQGFSLLKKWNLPESYCVIARDHDRDEFDAANSLLVLVRLVNLVSWRMGIGLRREPELVPAATPEAQAIGAKEIVLAELEIVMEDALADAG